MSQARPGRDLAAIAAVAALLLWPAIANGYPIVFSDVYAFIEQISRPRMIWDKPWSYGPFLAALHGSTTLWLPAVAQGLILSHLLWLLAESRGQASPGRHLALGIVLAAASAAPWFASLLMPDIFAPITVIALWLIGFPGPLGRGQRAWLLALATSAIAFHLAHLVLAGACIALLLILRAPHWKRAALTLALAIAWLTTANAIGHGRASVSPYGSIHLLARMADDGNVAPVLARHCPASGWHLCRWNGRLPADSDEFLWSPQGPISTHPGHAIGFGPEAREIAGLVLREEPIGVLRAGILNTWRQSWRVAVGDVLGPDWLDVSVAHSLRDFFPPEERARFAAGKQARGELRAWSAPFVAWQPWVLAAAALACAALLTRRHERAFALMVFAGLLANAAATGALSGPHDRYQARIAWLLLLPPALLALRSAPAARPLPATSAPAARSP